MSSLEGDVQREGEDLDALIAFYERAHKMGSSAPDTRPTTASRTVVMLKRLQSAQDTLKQAYREIDGVSDEQTYAERTASNTLYVGLLHIGIDPFTMDDRGQG